MPQDNRPEHLERFADDMFCFAKHSMNGGIAITQGAVLNSFLRLAKLSIIFLTCLNHLLPKKHL
jgi:hypothetical protein